MRAVPLRRLTAPLVAVACAAAVLTGCSSDQRSATARAPGPSTSTGSPAIRAAPTPVPPGPSLASVAWRAGVHGAVYARPVVAGSRVFVVTEDDDVYALSLRSGRVLWHESIGTPLTGVAAHAGCGNIDPLGITSTPVADPATGTLYVVGEVSKGADPPTVHRQLVGFDMATGAVTLSADATRRVAAAARSTCSSGPASSSTAAASTWDTAGSTATAATTTDGWSG